MRRKISQKFHVKNGAKTGKFHANFTLLGRSAEVLTWNVSWRLGFDYFLGGSAGPSEALSETPPETPF